MEFFTCSLPRISCRCRLTVWTLMDRVSAIPLLVSPLSIRSRTCLSLTDRILLLYNASNAATSDVIQSYVYRIAFQSLGFPDYSYGTAVNIVKSLMAFILVIIANKLADKYAETRLF